MDIEKIKADLKGATLTNSQLISLISKLTPIDEEQGKIIKRVIKTIVYGATVDTPKSILSFLSEIDIETELINQPIPEVYTMYKLHCCDNSYKIESKTLFTQRVIGLYSLKSKTCNLNGKSVRCFKV